MKYRRDNTGKTSFTVLLIILVLIALGGVFYGTYNWQHNKVKNSQQQVNQLVAQLHEAQKQNSGTQDNTANDTYTSLNGVKLKVYVPSREAKVVSPVAIVGEVPGNWSFEASFPVVLKDSKGTIVTQAPAQVLGNWMTEELVPFSVKLTYDSTVNGDGVLILKKDNPSGLAKNDDSVTIPIKF